MSQAVTAPTLGEPVEPDAPGRIPARLVALDGLRGVAMLLVLFNHYMIDVGEGSAVDRFVLRLAGGAWIGLDIFFVMSGFLITGILLAGKERPHYFRNYFARRTLRIFPIYYLYLFIFIVILPHVVPADARFPNMRALQKVVDTQEWFWLYGVNFWMTLRNQQPGNGMGVLWSLAVEEQLYIVWPFVVLFCKRQTLIRICVALLPVALALRVVMVNMGGGYFNFGAYNLPFCRMDSFALGACLMCILHGPTPHQTLVRAAKRIMLACIGAIVVIAYFARTLDHHHALNKTIGFTVVGWFFAALVAVCVVGPEGGWARRILNRRILFFFAKYSYAIYLSHSAVYRLVCVHIAAPTDFPLIGSMRLPGQAASGAIALALTLPLVMLSWRFFEKPLLNIKSLFPSPVATSGMRSAHDRNRHRPAVVVEDE